MPFTPPSDLYPTDEAIREARTATDWAGVEIRDRDPEGLCEGVLRARAVRALRQGRPAYLHISNYGGQPTVWASIACDHGEEVADDWFFGRAPKEIHDWYGGGCAYLSFSDLRRLKACISYIDAPRERESLVLKLARAA